MTGARSLAAAIAGAAAFASALAQPLPQPASETVSVQSTPSGTTTVTTSTTPSSESGRNEPKTQRTVVEDGRARIDELRIRGQLQRVTVDPKGRAPAYEIVVVEGARDLSDGPSPSRGAAGKRVWNVLKF